MGDRSVIGIKPTSASPTIFLYTQWGGEDRYKTLCEATAAAAPRQNDNAYFTRIFLSHIVGDYWNQELGFGIEVDNFCMPDYADVPVVVIEERNIEIFAGSSFDTLECVGVVNQLDWANPDHGYLLVEELATRALA
jgi:hypothetical protein